MTVGLVALGYMLCSAALREESLFTPLTSTLSGTVLLAAGK